MTDDPVGRGMRLRPGSIKRRPLNITRRGLVITELSKAGGLLPLVISPSIERLSLVTWALSNRELIRTQLLKHGGILFRNFDIPSTAVFEQLVIACSADPLPYKERSSPRTQVLNHIYTSTDYPAEGRIFFHNENSYQHIWPLKIFFFCAEPAVQGGETPIADCRSILERISPEIRQRFIDKGWMLVRNFGGGLSLSWRTAFQTEDKSVVEAYCREAGIETEWRGDRLRTRQVRRAVVRHPVTGELVWFNHAIFFHITTLDLSTQEELLAGFGEENLPNNTYYGDGSPIEPRVLEEIREAYQREAVSFAWQEGDILMLDNMLVAHGRNPYAGRRRILVAMAEPFSHHNSL
jgi:alpha-ketoglutarate-dependent taurine dioxygenase